MFQQLTGRKPSSAMTETDLLWELSSIVVEAERIVVVDEAHRVSQRAHDAIQNLVDVPDTLTTWVLVGAPDTKRKLAPELWSRKAAAVEFSKLDDDTAVAVLAEIDPVFARTDPDLLRRVNRAKAKGEWRYWMSVYARVKAYGDVIGAAIADEHVAMLTEDL